MLLKFAIALLAAATMTARIPSGGEVLEPSVLNEAERAISIAKVRNAAPSLAADEFARFYETNSMSASEKAIALVSSQRADGRWLSGTNDVTGAAVKILRRVSGLDAAPAGDAAEKDLEKDLKKKGG